MRPIDRDHHLKVLIESMSRDGRTEREIVAAVRRADRSTHEPRGRRDDPSHRGRA